MKKFLTIAASAVLAAVMAFSVTACSGGTSVKIIEIDLTEEEYAFILIIITSCAVPCIEIVYIKLQAAIISIRPVHQTNNLTSVKAIDILNDCKAYRRCFIGAEHLLRPIFIDRYAYRLLL